MSGVFSVDRNLISCRREAGESPGILAALSESLASPIPRFLYANEIKHL